MTRHDRHDPRCARGERRPRTRLHGWLAAVLLGWHGRCRPCELERIRRAEARAQLQLEAFRRIALYGRPAVVTVDGADYVVDLEQLQPRPLPAGIRFTPDGIARHDVA